MPKLLVTHTVADVETWLAFKAERARAVEGLGGSNVVDLVVHEGTSMVGVLSDVDDAEAVITTLASPSPELAAVMQRHGVLPPLVAYVEG